MVAALMERNSSFPAEANQVAQQAQGNYNNAVKILQKSGDDTEFEQLFITWVRAAFKAKGNASVIQDLVFWAETISRMGRENQKQFLSFCSNFFRQALLFNYGAKDLVYYEIKDVNFKFEKFAPFVHGANILGITEEINTGIYHIERNGNAKSILLDMSIKLTRLLHTKEA